MKRLTVIVTLAIVVLTAITGCQKDQAKESQRQLTELVGTMKLPQKLQDGLTLVDCYYNDNTLTYRNETSADTLSRINVDSLKATVLTRLQTNQSKLVKHLVAAGASLRYIYVHDNDSLVFGYTPDELQIKTESQE